MKLTLTKDYWQEIEALKIDDIAKGQIKAMVSAHLNHTIPPGATSNVLKSLLESGIEHIELTDEKGHTRLLEIVVHRPADKESLRQFTFLRPTYPTDGEILPIGAAFQSKAAGKVAHDIGSLLEYSMDRGEFTACHSITPLCRHLRPRPVKALTLVGDDKNLYELTVRQCPRDY